jgi:uncharacterized membrane protein
MSKITATSQEKVFAKALIVLTVFAVSLSLVRFVLAGSYEYWFLLWNVVLAWVPLIVAWVLYKKTPKGLLWSWPNFGLFIVWLAFLPNAFYLLSDFIHLAPIVYFDSTTTVETLYDVVLFQAYTLLGLLLGFTSLRLMHIRLQQKFPRRVTVIVGAVLLLSSFAMYVGRFLRWNSWDIITNPFGLLFDSERAINPAEHIPTFSTTILFFVFLSVLYIASLHLVAALGRPSKS